MVNCEMFDLNACVSKFEYIGTTNFLPKHGQMGMICSMNGQEYIYDGIKWQEFGASSNETIIKHPTHCKCCGAILKSNTCEYCGAEYYED